MEDEILLDDDNQPFENIEKADYMAEAYYNVEVLISTIDGVIKCKGERSNAWQPDGQYNYFFVKVKS
jgi:hypothetical protein